jgi:hypothetical protein
LISGGVLILNFCLGLSFSCSSELFLALLAILLGFAAFRACCWLLRLSFFQMTFLSFFDFLGLLAVFHGVLDSNFKLCDFVVNGLIKGEIEKPSGQFLGLIVMSY